MAIKSLDDDGQFGTFTVHAKFEGTKEERDANFATHDWRRDGDDDAVCAVCCSQIWHATAGWPCGAKVPRKELRR